MATQIAGVSPTTTISSTQPPPQTDPKAEAAKILAETRIGDTNTHRVNFIEAALDKITDPAQQAAVRAEVMKRLSSVEQGQLKALEPFVVRDAGGGQTTRFGGPNAVSQDQWIATARAKNDPDLKVYERLAGANDNASIKRAMDDVYNGRITPTQFAEAKAAVEEKSWTDGVGDFLSRFSPAGLAMEAAQPAIASLARDAGLGNTEWGAKLQKVLDTPGSMRAFNAGLSSGMVEGAKDFVVSIATMAGKTVQFAGDNSLAGSVGDGLRSVVPDSVKGWLRDVGVGGALNEALPSARRGEASVDALSKMGSAVVDYFGSKTPAQVGTDIKNGISKIWDSVKADHAKAAAQGPEAEARWWGKLVGRVTFEVASTFVPVAGQVGKGAKVAKGADVATDVIRAADKGGDVARAADKAGDAHKGTDAVRGADKAGDAADVKKVESERLDRIDEFARAASQIDIKMDHILVGEINKKGKAVGFHSRPDGVDPATARMITQLTQPDANGIYTGKVEVFNPATNSWVEKKGFSSFYPDNLSANQIETAIRNAYADALRNGNVANGAWSGDSGLGFTIQGYLNNGSISTAYPVRKP